MNRYHIKTGFREEDIEQLKHQTNKFRCIDYTYSAHCLENLKYRSLNLEKLLLYVRDFELEYEYIFEYYTKNNELEKICYRIPYTEHTDIILVLSNAKKIITIYTNSAEDNHVTLNKNLYIAEKVK